MEILRTPDDRFDGLPEYPFEPAYTEVGFGPERLRVHHVDVGEGPTVVLMHGEPTWSFLYRRIAARLAEAGIRALAPDLVGFGRSDKPADMGDHSYNRHVDAMRDWMEAVDVRDAVLFCQDWGGLIGLRLVTEHPDRWAAVIAANTGLPTGYGEPSPAFLAWREAAARMDPFDVGRVVQGGTLTTLPPEVVAGYDAPFPDERYKAAPKVMPSLVPIHPDDEGAAENRAAWEVLARWEKPFVTAFSDSDPITAGLDRVFQERIPGAAGRRHHVIEGAGHFLQEDRSDAVAQVIVEVVRSL